MVYFDYMTELIYGLNGYKTKWLYDYSRCLFLGFNISHDPNLNLILGILTTDYNN